MNITAWYNAMVLIVFLFFILPTYGQNPNKIFQVQIAPLNLIDPVSGVIQIGVQKKFNERIALSLDYGVEIDLGIRHGLREERKDYQYYKCKAALKYFLKQNSELPGFDPYLSLQAFYFPQHYRKENDWLITDTSYRYEYSTIERRVMVSSILIGAEHVSKRLVVDYYFGLGLRRMSIEHEPFNVVVGHRSEPRDWGPTSIDLYEGVFYRGHIALGFKIGYIINK